MAITVEYDVIAAEVHRKALENLTNEMAITLIRTSGSPIVVDAKDFSTCLLDTTPEHLGFAAYVLFHMGSSVVGTQAIVDLLGASGELRPGDGWLVNDPHTGGAMHQGDVTVIMPTFYGDDHMGWSFANMHLLDIGGGGISGYAPGARDVYQEGLRFPPIKIIRGGAIDTEWENFIAANVRAPEPVLNDIRSMIAANNTASRKLGEIIDEFGLERHLEFCAINKDLSEKVLRERISRIPDGIYRATDWNEFDGHNGPDQLLELALELEIRGDSLNFRYSGVPQINAFVNSAKGAMWGQTMTAIITMLAYGDLPMNGGVWRPVHIDLGEPGTIVNSIAPAPVSNAHSEVGMRACKLTKEVLNQALSLSDDPVLRGRVAGQSQDSMPGGAWFGPNQHGGTSVMFYVDNSAGVGGGAQTIQDGQDCYGMTCQTGCGLADIETHEAADPVLFLWRDLPANTGGPGRYRGGQGMTQAYALYGSEEVGGPAFNAVAEVPPRGVGGGYPGAAGGFEIWRDSNVTALLAQGKLPSRRRAQGVPDQLRSKEAFLTVGRGDIFITISGGAGGVSDPLLRPAEEVLSDVVAGWVTSDHAREVYGVVISPEAELDEAATRTRREEIRTARIGRPPAAALVDPPFTGISLDRAESGAWSCAHCGHGLSGEGSSWREGDVVKSERPIDERMGTDFGMRIRGRVESPRIVLREYYCPSCAAAISVEVVTEGMGTLPVPAVAE